VVLNRKTVVRVSTPNRHQSKMLKKYSLSPNEASNYSEETFDSVYPAKDLLEHLASSSRTAKRVVSRFSEYLRGPVLEVGGGVGQISDELIRSGHSVTVLEPDESLFENLVKRFSDDELIDVVRGTVGTLQKKAIFGSAIYINVLEHIAMTKKSSVEYLNSWYQTERSLFFRPLFHPSTALWMVCLDISEDTQKIN
jgi:hypothetical protein